jgi:hypothetical protein
LYALQRIDLAGKIPIVLKGLHDAARFQGFTKASKFRIDALGEFCLKWSQAFFP